MSEVVPRQGAPVDFEQGWDILAKVEQSRPDIVADVLLYPTVGIWLVRALRTSDKLGYLNCLAAAAAIRAGLEREIDVPVTGGMAWLPTVGMMRLPGARVATIRSTPTGPEPAGSFTPLTRHRVEANGIAIDIRLDTTDPYREFAEPLPANPLGAAEVANWRRLLNDAWEILTDRHAGYARELAAGLSALVPIRSGRKVAGASSRAAFGGVALSTKNSPTDLAEALVHELQHSKLNGLLDLLPLERGDSAAVWYAPWRPDARPLLGVLHGIYAFVSVVEFWQIERDHVADAERAAAHRTFAHRRLQVREAVDSVRSASALTELGQHLVDVADKRITACEDAPVPADILRDVTRAADQDRANWQNRQNS